MCRSATPDVTIATIKFTIILLARLSQNRGKMVSKTTGEVYGVDFADLWSEPSSIYKLNH